MTRTLSDNHYEAARDAAIALGRGEGESAASWVFDGNTERHVYAWYLSGIEDGDPEVLDKLPSADLSGQWADTLTPRGLADLVASEVDGVEASELIALPMTLDALCDAYETAFNDAVCAEVERTARKMLA